MVGVKTFVISVGAVLSVYLQPGARSQSTISLSSQDDMPTCSQLDEELEWLKENRRLRSVVESDRRRIKTLENVSSVLSVENRQLKLDKERSEMRSRESFRDEVKYIGSYGPPAQIHAGITKVEDSIYVLRQTGIDVYEDRLNFRLLKRIDLNRLLNPADIIYSEISKSVYISQQGPERCVWVMPTIGEHRLTKWKSAATRSLTLSLSKDGHFMMLQEGEPFSQLEIYSLNGSLIRTLQLPQDIRGPHHVVQTSDGNFIISHQLNNATGPRVISQLTNDGQVIHRFIPRNQSENLNIERYLCLDSENNRLFVSDRYNHRVIIFDSKVLTWRRLLVSDGMTGVASPQAMFYDAGKKYLVVTESFLRFTVYEVN